MKTLKFKLKKGDAFKVVEQLPKKYYWRFYKNALNQVFLIYTYFDDTGFEYDALIPIRAENSKTIRAIVCKYYFDKSKRDDNIFYYITEDIRNAISAHIAELEGVELE
jgi:hypothetical protein